MTPAEFNQFRALAGQLSKQYIKQEIASPDWRSIDGRERKKRIEAAKDDARKAARESLFGGAINDDAPPLPSGFVWAR